MKIIEDELFRVTWTRSHGIDREQDNGFKSAIKFCINKRNEGWTVDNFEADLERTIEETSNLYGPYKDGLLYGLRLNIQELQGITVSG